MLKDFGQTEVRGRWLIEMCLSYLPRTTRPGCSRLQVCSPSPVDHVDHRTFRSMIDAVPLQRLPSMAPRGHQDLAVLDEK